MAYRLLGAVDVAVLFGLSQVAVVFVIAWRHGRYCREVLDPLAAQIVADAGRRVRAAAERHAEAGCRAALVRARPAGTPPAGAAWPASVVLQGGRGRPDGRPAEDRS